MKQAKSINTPLTDELCRSLKAGDRVLLSGDVFTARDAAHKRLCETIMRREDLPVPLHGSVIFYAAPTPPPPGRVIGSIGPTTSGRMDAYAPQLMAAGLKGMIGKGRRSEEVRKAMQEHCAVYFGAIGGIAALTSQCVSAFSVVAYEDMGPEAIMKLKLDSLPVIVINDCYGGDLFDLKGEY